LRQRFHLESMVSRRALDTRTSLGLAPFRKRWSSSRSIRSTPSGGGSGCAGVGAGNLMDSGAHVAFASNLPQPAVCRSRQNIIGSRHETRIGHGASVKEPAMSDSYHSRTIRKSGHCAFQNRPLGVETGPAPTAKKEHIANKEQTVYIASLAVGPARREWARVVGPPNRRHIGSEGNGPRRATSRRRFIHG
jgi:hypothetical protein